MGVHNFALLGLLSRRRPAGLCRDYSALFPPCIFFFRFYSKQATSSVLTSYARRGKRFLEDIPMTCVHCDLFCNMCWLRFYFALAKSNVNYFVTLRWKDFSLFRDAKLIAYVRQRDYFIEISCYYISRKKGKNKSNCQQTQQTKPCESSKLRHGTHSERKIRNPSLYE